MKELHNNFITKNLFITTVILISIFFLNSCSLGTSASSTNLKTEVPTNSLTQSPALTLDLSSSTLEPSQIIVPSPTDTSEPTKTELPTVTPTELIVAATLESSPSPTTQLCENKAEFVKNLSLAENSKLKPGELIAKVWRIKNSGTCTWTTGYLLVFVSGNSFSSPESIALPNTVAPGESVDLRVNVNSPLTYGMYSGTWMLQDESGNKFGVGEQADQPLLIAIEVVAPQLPGCI